MGFADQAQRTLSMLGATPGWHRLKELRPDLDDATVASVLDEAARFAETVLAPLNAGGDRQGAQVLEGRVKTPPGFKEAFKRYGEAGWLGSSLSEKYGGQDLPLTIAAACGPLFERGCVALMMCAGSTRAAAHLLAEAADRDTAQEWVPRLAQGEWAGTICISEADAGSDVGRLRTKAINRDGAWFISGEKTWISFGDHDMTTRIGHCLLARTKNEVGTRGISLFLVPDQIAGEQNGVSLSRIEDKMGLHGSPTCTLLFNNSQGVLIGEEGRGLPQLFSMIELMRLQTGCQGLGLASASVDIAEAYAHARRQGGPPDLPAVPIADHPDVKRQLHAMRLQTEVLRAAVLELATLMDLARLGTDPDLRQDYRDLAAWMLPLIKNFGAAAGFDVSNAGIQVLGGAGYTRDWPLEQYLRDARVMTIYEGTTGMQALDFLVRRLWRDEGRVLQLFQERMTAELASLAEEDPRSTELARDALAAFLVSSKRMLALRGDPTTAFFEANDYLEAGWKVITAWMRVRLQALAR